MPYPKGSQKPGSKLVESQIPEIREMLSKGRSQQRIAIRYGVHKSVIKRIGDGERWKHVN